MKRARLDRLKSSAETRSTVDKWSAWPQAAAADKGKARGAVGGGAAELFSPVRVLSVGVELLLVWALVPSRVRLPKVRRARLGRRPVAWVVALSVVVKAVWLAVVVGA